MFPSFRGEGALDLYRVAADGSGTPKLLFSDEGIKQPNSWLPGGDGLIFQRQPDPESDFDIWLLPTSGDGKAVPLVEGPANDLHAALSPDGRWLAYASDQSGRYEIYLRRYPELDGLRRVSNSGGMGPLWRSDSRELFFYRQASEGRPSVTFMRVPLDAGPGTPESLWASPLVVSLGSPYGSGYDVTPDGQRILVPMIEEEWPLFLPELRVVFNWYEELTDRFER